MKVHVTVRLPDDDDEEVASSTGIASTPFAELEDTPERAFAIAMEHLEIDR